MTTDFPREQTSPILSPPGVKMRPFLIATSIVWSLPVQAGSTLVWVDSAEAQTTALAEEIQALAGPVRLFQLAGGKALNHQTARLAIGAAEEAWRQVRPDLMAAALQQARAALRNDPTAGDAARMRRLLCLEAAYEVGEFRAEKARVLMKQALALGLESLPTDLSHTLSPIVDELRAETIESVELNFRLPPGARLYVDDQPHDQGNTIKVAAGLHLVGASLQGHRPSYRWVEASGRGSHIDLLPTAAPELATLTIGLTAAARGDHVQADALRRKLGLQALVLCSLRMLGGRYDGRCIRHGDDGSKRESVVSFHSEEPLSGPAARLWQGLQEAPQVTVGPPESAQRVDPGRRYALAGGSLMTLGVIGLGASGYWALSAADTHEVYRNTPQTDTEELERLRVNGQSAALGADIAAGVGVLFTAVGSGLLYQAAAKRQGLAAFVGAQP